MASSTSRRTARSVSTTSGWVTSTGASVPVLVAPPTKSSGAKLRFGRTSLADERTHISLGERSYATYNGFYLGDEVELPDGRRGCIDEIVVREVRADYDRSGDHYPTYSVVRLDNQYWLDGWLTRV